MKKIFYLSTCDTCKRIITDLGLKEHNFEFQDIKVKHISGIELDFCMKATGSYESLFSRKARKYKELGLSTKKLSESEIRKLILSDYTFLKRPVIIIDQDVFAGNSKEETDKVKRKLKK